MYRLGRRGWLVRLGLRLARGVCRFCCLFGRKKVGGLLVEHGERGGEEYVLKMAMCRGPLPVGWGIEPWTLNCPGEPFSAKRQIVSRPYQRTIK